MTSFQKITKLSSGRLKNSVSHYLLRTFTSKSKWKSVVGLEVHAQIASASKLFSGSKTTFGAPLNSCVSLFDASVPGTLPVLNKRCVEAGVKTALALRCHINEVSMFDRKHYFYADLPAGYQITQQRMPLAVNGILSFPVFVPGVTKKPYIKSIRLQQLQLEQDSGKSLHDDEARRSLVDLNRAGVPLMELVFDPGLSDGEEAAALVKELSLIMRRYGTCSCRMEEGALRVDANVSLHKKGEPLGTRTEIKNIGSIRAVAQAIAYEITRQKDILDAGGKIHNETRSWDATSKKTIAMRDKEVQQDYRFMPEPNLPPLYVDTGFTDLKGLINVANIRKNIPELPEETRLRLTNKMKLPQETAIILVNEPVLLEYFEKILQRNPAAAVKVVANLLVNDLITLCNKHDVNLENCKITSDQLSEIVDYLQKDVINLQAARMILNEIQTLEEIESVDEIIEKNNLKQITNPEEIENLCLTCISRNEKAVQQYKAGKKKVIYAIAGDVAKLSKQKANMELVVEKLKELLRK